MHSCPGSHVKILSSFPWPSYQVHWKIWWFYNVAEETELNREMHVLLKFSVDFLYFSLKLSLWDIFLPRTPGLFFAYYNTLFHSAQTLRLTSPSEGDPHSHGQTTIYADHPILSYSVSRTGLFLGFCKVCLFENHQFNIFKIFSNFIFHNNTCISYIQ